MTKIEKRILQSTLAALIHEKMKADGMVKPGLRLEFTVVVKSPQTRVYITEVSDVASVNDIPLFDLDLGVRIHNVVNNANIRTVGDIRLKTLRQMYQYRHFKRVSAKRLKDKLAEIGVDLDWDV